MYQKFIILSDGTLRFGRVYMHRDLLLPSERCTYGGGLWRVDEGRRAILLFGRSFDFGPPDFDYVRHIDWSGTHSPLRTLLYLPHWPDEDRVEAVYAYPTMP